MNVRFFRGITYDFSNNSILSLNIWKGDKQKQPDGRSVMPKVLSAIGGVV